METIGKYNPELEQAPPKLSHDLIAMSDEEAKALTERIAHFDGTIRIFVHPFYYLARNGASKSQIGESKQTLAFLSNLLARSKEETPAILVMEEEVLADEASEALEGFSEDSNNDFYYLRTFNNEGTPKLIPAESDHEKDIAECWNIFSRILHRLGVKKVIIAGGDFDIETLDDEQKQKYLPIIKPFLDQRVGKNEKNLNYTPKACAGSAAVMLAHNFDVDISNFAHPMKPKDLREIEKI